MESDAEPEVPNSEDSDSENQTVETNCLRFLREILDDININGNLPYIKQVIAMEYVPYSLRICGTELSLLATQLTMGRQQRACLLARMDSKEALFILKLLYLNTKTAKTPLFSEQESGISSRLTVVQRGIEAAVSFMHCWLDFVPRHPTTVLLAEEVIRFAIFHIKESILPFYAKENHHKKTLIYLANNANRYDKLVTTFSHLLKLTAKAIPSFDPEKDTDLIKNVIQVVCRCIFTDTENAELEKAAFTVFQTVFRVNLHLRITSSALEKFACQELFSQLATQSKLEKNRSRKKIIPLVNENVRTFVSVALHLVQTLAHAVLREGDRMNLETKADLFQSVIQKVGTLLFQVVFTDICIANEANPILVELLEQQGNHQMPAASALVAVLGLKLAHILLDWDEKKDLALGTIAIVNLGAIISSMRKLENFCHQNANEMEMVVEKAMEREGLHTQEYEPSPRIHLRRAQRYQALQAFVLDSLKKYEQKDAWKFCLLNWFHVQDTLEATADCEFAESVTRTRALLASKLHEIHSEVSTPDDLSEEESKLAFNCLLVSVSSFKSKQNTWAELLLSFDKHHPVSLCVVALGTFSQLLLSYPDWLNDPESVIVTLFKKFATDSSLRIRLAMIKHLSRIILHHEREQIWLNMYFVLTARLFDHKDEVRKNAVLALDQICSENPDWLHTQETFCRFLTFLRTEPSYPIADQAIVGVFRKQWFIPVFRESVDQKSLVTKTQLIRLFLTAYNPKEHQACLTVLFKKLFKPANDQALAKLSLEETTRAGEELLNFWIQKPELIKDLDYFLITWAQTCPEMFEKTLEGFLAIFRLHFWKLLQEPVKESRLFKTLVEQADWLSCALKVITHLLPALATPPLVNPDWQQLEKLLIFCIICKRSIEPKTFVHCWSNVVKFVTKDYTKAKELLVEIYPVMIEYVGLKSDELLARKLQMFQGLFLRKLSMLGFLGRYFGFENLEKPSTGFQESGMCSPIQFQLSCFIQGFIENCFSCPFSDCTEVALEALKVLGIFTVRYDNLLARGFLQQFYSRHLQEKTDRPDFHLHVLHNLTIYLEEQPKNPVPAITATIMQVYAKEIYKSLVNKDIWIRREALKLVGYIFQQRITSYENSIPFLVAMSSSVRTRSSLGLKSLTLLKIVCEIDQIVSFSEESLWRTYQFQRKVQGFKIVRAARKGKALMTEFYCILDGDKTKCKFLGRLMRVLAAPNSNLGFLNFVAETLAHLPYKSQVEVEVVIKGEKLARNMGADALRQFEQALLAPTELLTDEVEERAELLRRLPEDISVTQDILVVFQCCILLMEVVTCLRNAYGVEGWDGSDTGVTVDLARDSEVIFNPTAILSDLNSSSDINERERLVDRYIQCRLLC